jgi:hypothetical protein
VELSFRFQIGQQLPRMIDADDPRDALANYFISRGRPPSPRKHLSSRNLPADLQSRTERTLWIRRYGSLRILGQHVGRYLYRWSAGQQGYAARVTRGLAHSTLALPDLPVRFHLT